MENFLKKINEQILLSDELKSSSVFSAVVESTSKQFGKVPDMEFLEILESNLSAVNDLMKSSAVTILQQTVSQKIMEMKSSDINYIISTKANEFDIIAFAEKIKENQEAYSDPKVKSYIDALITEASKKAVPSYEFIPYIQQALPGLTQYPIITESKAKLDEYMKDNYPKLATINTLRILEGSSYNNRYVNSAAICNKLREYIFEGKFVADNMEHELSKLGKLQIIDDTIKAIREHNAIHNKSFELGLGNKNVSVNDFYGVGLLESKDGFNSLTTFINDKFYTLTNNPNHSTGKKIDEGVYAVDSITVFNKHKDLYNAVHLFEQFNFKNVDGKFVSTVCPNTTIVLEPTNESANKITINGITVTGSHDFPKVNAVINEDSNTRMAIRNLVANMGMYVYCSDIKKITESTTGESSTIIKHNEKFYVINKDVATKTSGYKLAKMISEKYNYDISPLFKIEIDTKLARLNKIDEDRKLVLASIEKFNEALATFKSIEESDVVDSKKALIREQKSQIEGLIEVANYEIKKLNEEFDSEMSGEGESEEVTTDDDTAASTEESQDDSIKENAFDGEAIDGNGAESLITVLQSEGLIPTEVPQEFKTLVADFIKLGLDKNAIVSAIKAAFVGEGFMDNVKVMGGGNAANDEMAKNIHSLLGRFTPESIAKKLYDGIISKLDALEDKSTFNPEYQTLSFQAAKLSDAIKGDPFQAKRQEYAAQRSGKSAEAHNKRMEEIKAGKYVPTNESQEEGTEAEISPEEQETAILDLIKLVIEDPEMPKENIQGLISGLEEGIEKAPQEVKDEIKQTVVSAKEKIGLNDAPVMENVSWLFNGSINKLKSLNMSESQITDSINKAINEGTESKLSLVRIVEEFEMGIEIAKDKAEAESNPLAKFKQEMKELASGGGKVQQVLATIKDKQLGVESGAIGKINDLIADMFEINPNLSVDDVTKTVLGIVGQASTDLVQKGEAEHEKTETPKEESQEEKVEKVQGEEADDKKKEE